LKIINLFAVVLLLLSLRTAAQQKGMLQGKVVYLSTIKPVEGATISIRKLRKQTKTNNQGAYILTGIPYGKYEVEIFFENMQKIEQQIIIDKETVELNAELVQITGKLKEVNIISEKEETSGMERMKSVDGFGIYESKKSEVIILKDINANLATNNARQVFNKVPGLNIWESDQAGLQLGIGGRGLSPNRTANFNTRQNGYDMSADALGYPESYYSPPVEALERIEIVRGAASLQYGTQFGGMVNFVFQKGPTNKKIEVASKQTLGSFGFFGSYNSISGTIAKGRLNYYTLFNHKQGNGWRQNSGFEVNTVYTSATYDITEKFSVNADYTFMQYNAQQPGGLTDAQFATDPRASYRDRNWFNVNWNLFALTANYKFNERTKINTRNFGLLSQRNSVGNLSRINMIDLGGNRTLIKGDFSNIGNETRLLHQYKLFNKNHTFLVGSRLYFGTTTALQGDGSNGSEADYTFNNPDNLEGSDYTFTNKNASAFIENIFRINDKWSITPGVRFEYINTASDGYYAVQTRDFAGNIITDTNIYDQQQNIRSFVLGGIGVSYKATTYLEVYGNISQNYRAINFTDLRIMNPNLKVDPNMKDESGYSADLGVRGKLKDYLNYDITVFLLSYNDRIGQMLKTDEPPLYQDYRFRTNIADSRNAGVECFIELDLWKLINKNKTKTSLLLFNNIAYVNAKYIHAHDKAIENNDVEMAPPIVWRGGITFKQSGFSATFQGNYVAQQFTDATNAVLVAGAVNGIIPAYTVFDCSASYTFRKYSIEASANNLLNQMYFTRRADSYPGPGIIPSDGRSFYVTLGIKI
jgi:Fe(3+) dicitrate transport protein